MSSQASWREAASFAHAAMSSAVEKDSAFRKRMMPVFFILYFSMGCSLGNIKKAPVGWHRSNAL